MSAFKVGERIKVKLSGGRLVDAEIKAIIGTTDGIRLQVSFGEETALIYLWQVVEKLRQYPDVGRWTIEVMPSPLPSSPSQFQL